MRLSESHGVDDNLPERIAYQGDPETAYYFWSILEAVEYRWTLTEAMQQPEALLNDVLMIAALHRKMRHLEDKSSNA